MDYKRLKNQYSAAKREKIMWITILTLIVIIALQCVIGVLLWGVGRRYRSLYEEALEGRVELQEEINSLRENSKTEEKEDELIEPPFVTGGETEDANESGIGD